MSAAPESWRAIADGADLDRSFEELSTCEGFVSESLKGKLRSIQLRADEASEHFERAERMFEREPGTPENLLRRIDSLIFAYENALLETIERVEEVDIEEVSAPSSLERAMRMFPAMATIVAEKTRVDALMLIHAGRCDLALQLFRDLVHDGASPESLPGLYLGLAASQFGIGDESAAWKSLEAAGLATQACRVLLSQVLAAGALVGVFSYLNCPDEADSWRSFLRRLKCPAKTVEVAVARGEKIRERSEREGRLLVF